MEGIFVPRKEVLSERSRAKKGGEQTGASTLENMAGRKVPGWGGLVWCFWVTRKWEEVVGGCEGGGE